MERDIWRVMVAALWRLPRTRDRRQLYSDREVLAILFWAALHDRSINWACRRSSWPTQAWRRRLPDQSTMSRRLREPRILGVLELVLRLVQEGWDDGDDLALLDGKPLAVNSFSQDRDASNGWGAGQHQRGYKLHALTANARRLIAHRVEPMNVPESTVAAGLLREAGVREGTLVLGDASYDTNPLHEVARSCGLQLLAPRRKPGTSLSDGHRQDPGRVLSTTLLEGDPEIARWQRGHRAAVEHYFAGLSAAGLHALPPWVRTLPRVRVWVAAKLALNAARIARNRTGVA